MTTSAVKEFTRFFKEYLDLCLSPGWPEDNTEPEEIIKSLEVAHHVEKIIQKMKSKNCFENFLDLLCTNRNFTHIFLQNCMSDPSKFILQKIINSDAQVSLIDIAFEGFRNLYSEDRLVESLSQLMLEAASKETLLRNMSTVLPAYKVQEINNQLHLFAILECDSDEVLADTLKDCCQEMMDALVLCLVKDNMVGLRKDDTELVRRKIITGFTNVMICRNTSAKNFWENLFNVDKENIVEMCLKYKALGEMVFEALGDNYRQIINKVPSESCYIQFTESQLYSKCNIISESETLKLEFMEYMKNNGYEESCMPILQC